MEEEVSSFPWRELAPGSPVTHCSRISQGLAICLRLTYAWSKTVCHRALSVAVEGLLVQPKIYGCVWLDLFLSYTKSEISVSRSLKSERGLQRYSYLKQEPVISAIRGLPWFSGGVEPTYTQKKWCQECWTGLLHCLFFFFFLVFPCFLLQQKLFVKFIPNSTVVQCPNISFFVRKMFP